MIIRNEVQKMKKFKRKIVDYSVVVVGPLAIFAAVLDFLSKQAVLKNIKPYEIIPVINDFFNLTLTFNTGIAFGIFSSLSSEIRSTLVISLTLLAILAVFSFLSRLNYRGPLANVAFGLILGGAFGNILDRIQYGAVVDFLDFYISTYHWPAFNLADSFICIGVTLLLFYKTPETTSNKPFSES